ncbi:hypothetical protein GCM10011371_19900 [Novosphingobium marinum]|uniref:Uncharacterized protein (DUF433 family) n=1 Tax=Novosphingobium marinum TaxID=1514948 RepID=A0A7Y9XX02_9SPHN|nr:DUF433 domain-containing protein [Novosphingobium marinum]NYH96102.1 uncharacterized protein (DUF433 family) [Novosphingobium marinum]GGC32502.1 hypothetical protein GCM10011371_19900 [Novosphingobium marinum]
MLDIDNVIAAFSEDQASKLTSLSIGRLRYWAKTGFFAPSFIANAPGPYGKFYSFKDIVALRTLEMLRVRNGVPLQHLRKVAERLSHLRDDLWTQTKLRVWDRKVVFDEPETGRAREVVSGQYVEEYELVEIIAETGDEIRAMKSRDRGDFGKVVVEKGVHRGAPIISGTRIPVISIQRLHEDGFSIEAIIDEYPRLTAKDVRAALKHKLEKAA